ncbi:DUF2628 domain-containing protein [Lichenihabitans sp. PAMC28606]|uniref:DUF2628 domain-containing protein n=1 Tax=Lichenihabitans sp. PAMC28606 TaxID=2880932 RepID=UPI001D09A284|nr:DUF2628 domain-containing protein [Lichenihabitans sp. PAMC28606]UDL93445.1 DUF2628 domain-containing protein [Lichenihabitans sp. PAMC28606]
MTIYTVHVPQDAGDRVALADRTVFVRDGFSVWAFLFGPLFLLRYRAWLAALVWLVLVVAGAWGAQALHLPGMVRFGLLVILAIFMGLEGNALRGAALGSRGYRSTDVVAGAGREASERRYFASHDVEPVADRSPSPLVRATASSRQQSRLTNNETIIGSFPQHEG